MCDRVAGCVEVVLCAEQARSHSDRTPFLDGLFFAPCAGGCTRE
jgi:hypothetical protein